MLPQPLWSLAPQPPPAVAQVDRSLSHAAQDSMAMCLTQRGTTPRGCHRPRPGRHCRGPGDLGVPTRTGGRESYRHVCSQHGVVLSRSAFAFSGGEGVCVIVDVGGAFSTTKSHNRSWVCVRFQSRKRVIVNVGCAFSTAKTHNRSWVCVFRWKTRGH